MTVAGSETKKTASAALESQNKMKATISKQKKGRT